MKILFLSYSDITKKNAGGIERISNGNACQQIALFGMEYYSVHLTYDSKTEAVADCHPCKAMMHVPYYMHSELRNCIEQWNIDIILCTDIEYIATVTSVVKDLPHRPKIVFWHHFNVGFERSRLWWSIKRYASRVDMHKQTVKKLWWVTKYAYKRIRATIALPGTFRRANEMADKTVLLSEAFVRPYIKFANLKDIDKLVYINNTNTYPESIDDKGLRNKSNTVLVVCRLDEFQKRVSFCLKVWQKIEMDERLKDWKLKILGTGISEESYKALAQKLHLRRISFEGQQKPIEYYKEAKIFMMTSRHEGWGLTLTEAQQMGVVPIAMDSYESLRDIIVDGENGLIVPNGDIKSFTDRMTDLMVDDNCRLAIASQAVQMSSRFAPEEINRQWYELFKTLSADYEKY